MPAIMTHDFFGKDVYDECFSTIGMTADERDAFLLGNQGPDPLFYTLIDPALKDFRNVGDVMHHERPTSLICAMRLAYEALDSSDRASGRAYALGFLCHYLLDSAMHPLVYAEQYAFCDAGVEGLDRSAGSYVHAEIERDFDEWCSIRSFTARSRPTSPTARCCASTSRRSKPWAACMRSCSRASMASMRRRTSM